MAGSSAVYIVRGEAIFDFELPDELRDISVDNLKLSIVTDSGIFNSPEISIFNPGTGDWIKLDGVNQGANLITNAAKFVDPKGVVKIRLSAENTSNCYYLNLGLEGHR
jgi:hypothetical protein